jgi:hypothetical protein
MAKIVKSQKRLGNPNSTRASNKSAMSSAAVPRVVQKA